MTWVIGPKSDPDFPTLFPNIHQEHHSGAGLVQEQTHLAALHHCHQWKHTRPAPLTVGTRVMTLLPPP